MQSDRRRFLAEGITILVSILLAFWIDAWWDGHIERGRAEELLVAIGADVQATQQHIAEKIARTNTVTSSAQTLLEGIDQDVDQSTLDSLLLTLGSVFVASVWSPVNHSYDQALGSGSFELVRDQRLRLLLARYVGSMAEVSFWNDFINEQYRFQLEPFMVANAIYSEMAAPDVRALLIRGPYTTDLRALGSSRELWNLVTLKLELEAILRNKLEDALDTADEVIAALPPPE